MFNTSEKDRSYFLKFFGLAAILLAVVVGLMLIFLGSESSELPQLTGVLRKGDPDHDWYRQYLTISNPKVQMTRNIAGNRLVLFAGLLRNRGERVLDTVELELSFFNYAEPVFQTTRFAIHPEPVVRTSPLGVLEERGFAVYVEEFPEEWLAQHAEMAISGFRFLKPSDTE